MCILGSRFACGGKVVHIGGSEEVDASLLPSMHLGTPDILAKDFNLPAIREYNAAKRKQHELEMADRRDARQHQVALLMMVIAGLWLLGDLLGILFGAINGEFAGTLANPGFAVLSGVGGFKISQHQSGPSRR